MTEPLSDEKLKLIAEICRDLNKEQDRFIRTTGVMLGDLLAEVARLKAENANLRREIDTATTALEAQGQAAFVAGMRRKAAVPPGSLTDAVEAIRAAGGSDWDKIPDVEAYLDRKAPDLDSLAAEIEAFAWNYFVAVKPETETVQVAVREMLKAALEGGDGG